METTSREYLTHCRSLAVLGGTFDPIHRGHLAIAEAVLARYAPQRVLFIPCARPPHKENEEVTPAEHRYQMTLLATCAHPSFDVSRMELERPGVTYTIDTARILAGMCPADAQIYWVIGADSVVQLHTWKGAEELAQLCRFIVVPRPGCTKKRAVDTMRAYNARFGERFFWMDMPKADISGTEIRRRFARGESVRAFIPRPVEDYANTHSLYRGPLSFEAVKAALEKRLSPKRFMHTLGVVNEAEKLARFYGAPAGKARWAALLHDCAKEYSTDKKAALCERWGIALDSTRPSTIEIAHAHIGAESARRDYYITDAEILQAIRFHTTGHGAMTLLDKVVMLADFIEPHREDYPPLAQMRKLAYKDMNKALRVGINYTIKEEMQAGNPICHASFDALEILKGAEQ